MKYEINKLPNSEVEISVEISVEEMEPHIKRAAILISEENEIEGFRKGKAPYDIVKNRFGELVIYEKAADLAIRKTYPKLMEKLTTDGILNTLHPPIGKPEIAVTKLAPGNELRFKVKFAVLPEVTLPDYKEIARCAAGNKKEISVSDKEIREALNWICESRAALIAVDRAAQKRDGVEIDFQTRQGGVKIESSESQNHPLIIGRGKFLPGFEENLIGMKAGEEKSFTLVAPENWHEKSMAGKVFDFLVTMKSVQDRKVPEINDEFAKSLGNFSSLDALKTNIKEGLANEKRDKEKQRIRSLIIEETAKESKMDIPATLILSELEKMIDELKSGVEKMGMKWEDYLLHIKKNMEELKKEWREEAEKRVRIALCLREIAAMEKIAVSEEEVTERAHKFLEQYRSAEVAAENAIDPVRSQTPEASVVPQEAERTSNGVDTESLREYTKNVLTNEKVFEMLEHENTRT